MSWLARLSSRTRGAHWAAQWGIAGGLVLAGFAARSALFGAEPVFPYVLSYLVVALCGFLFRGGAGVFAIGLSAALGIYLYVDPSFGRLLTNRNDAVALGLFLFISLLTLRMMGALHAARAEADAARARAEAGERERALLLVEYGHRVKNDLASIAAVLRLEAGHAPEPAADILREAAGRVGVLARVHLHLSRSAAGEVAVDARGLLQDLAADIGVAVANRLAVSVRVDADAVTLPAARAGAVGLVTNELVTNAIKHAFPDGRGGTVEIGLHRREGALVLSVADDGIGMNGTRDGAAGSGGLGERIVRALAAQLGGTLETQPRTKGGTLRSVRFSAQ